MSLSHMQSRAPTVRLRLARPAMGFLLGAIALILLPIYAPTFFWLKVAPISSWSV